MIQRVLELWSLGILEEEAEEEEALE